MIVAAARRARLDGREGAAPRRASRGCREPAPRSGCALRARAPGRAVHVDIKKLGRFWTVGKRDPRRRRHRAAADAGWQYLHLAIDDHSRLAYCELLASERNARLRRLPPPRRRLVRRARDHGRARPHRQRQGYHSHAWRDTCAELGIGRRYTRPYPPRTNGKAEALIKTLLREWAYRFAYPTSAHRARALPGYLRWYNRRRPHSSLGGRPPISRVSHLCGQYT